MNLWLNENFYDNRKIKRLIYELGNDAIPCLHKLWFYAQKYAVDNLLEDDKIGILKDFDNTDIEMIVGWSGDKGVFVKVLNSLKLIENRYGQYFIHDFLDNNPQISVLITQKKNGSKYAKKRWDRKQIGDPMGDPLDTPIGDLIATEKKRKEKKRKDTIHSNELIVSYVIDRFNKITKKSRPISLNNPTYHKLININIKELKTKYGIKEDDDIKKDFDFVLDNQKKIADNPKDIWSRYELDTLLAKKNYFKYREADPHKSNQEPERPRGEEIR